MKNIFILIGFFLTFIHNINAANYGLYGYCTESNYINKRILNIMGYPFQINLNESYNYLIYLGIIIFLIILYFVIEKKLKNRGKIKDNKVDKKYKGKYNSNLILILLLFGIFLIFNIRINTTHELLTSSNCRELIDTAKPVIYLYPQEKQKIKVELDYKGEIIADYPRYDDKIKGWEVEAYPDGKVVDLRDGKEYSYLFWEGMLKKKIDWDLSSGFVVEGKNAREFLREKLEYLGLTPKEYNEFIVYWYPKMMKNKYNLVHFATKKYTDYTPLKITPKPDSLLRVFMLMKKLDKKINIPEQKLEHFERKGFSVIEWGGSELN